MAAEKPKVYVVPIPSRNTEIAALKKMIGEIGCEIVGAKEPIENYEGCVSKADVIVVLICKEAAKNPIVGKIIELAVKLGKRVVGVWAEDASEEDLPEGLRRHGEASVTFKTTPLKQCILGEKPEWQNPDGSPQGKKKTPRHHC
ncbi:MAG: hypothetical protein WCA78_09590 [Rhizomicrobium sp.]